MIIVTEFCWIRVTAEGLVLTELTEGINVIDVQSRTEARLFVLPDLRMMPVSASV